MTHSQKVRRVIRVLEQHLGVPRQTRKRPPPLDMLVATVLSQNTNDKNSHGAYERLRHRYPRWEDVRYAPVRDLVALLKAGGMANQKSRRIKDILGVVESRYGGYRLSALKRWPTDRILAELTSINGVGPKTAACVCLFSLRRDICPVDTHVHRLSGRLGLAPGARTPEETFRMLRGMIPRGKSYSLHTNLIRFGRRTCHAHSPACGTCPLSAMCMYEQKTVQSRHRNVRSRANHDFMLLDNV